MLSLFHLHHKNIQLQCPEGHSREMNWHGVLGIEIIATVKEIKRRSSMINRMEACLYMHSC